MRRKIDQHSFDLIIWGLIGAMVLSVFLLCGCSSVPERKCIAIETYESEAQCCEYDNRTLHQRYGSTLYYREVVLVATFENDIPIRTKFVETVRSYEEHKILTFELGDVVPVVIMKKMYDDGSESYEIYKINGKVLQGEIE